MLNNIKVSVIIPIFGVEKFIERCARSLFSQTLKEMEFIFVDDCTRDASMDILKRVMDDYPERKTQVTILKHEQNKGLPQARKTGIMVAKGEFIAHCDSDDWVDENMYHKLYEKATSEDADIVICGYYKSDGLSFEEIVSIKPQNHLLTGPVWNKMARRELYFDHEITFPIYAKAEDGALMVQLSYYANRIVNLDEPLYFYFFNPDSICNIMTEEAMLKRLKEEKSNVDLRIEFLKRIGVFEQYKSDVIRWKLVSRNNLLPYYHKRKYRILWRNTYPEINTQYFLSKDFTKKAKLIFLFDLLGLHNLWERFRVSVLKK